EVVGHLQWGMIDWRDAGLPVESVPQITAYDLHTLLEADGAVVVDVREPFEWFDGHVPGALHVPMFEAVARAADLPADRPKAVVRGPRLTGCATGVIGFSRLSVSCVAPICCPRGSTPARCSTSAFCSAAPRARSARASLPSACRRAAS